MRARNCLHPGARRVQIATARYLSAKGFPSPHLQENNKGKKMGGRLGGRLTTLSEIDQENAEPEGRLAKAGFCSTRLGPGLWAL